MANGSPSEPDTPRLLTVREVATTLRVSRMTVHRLIQGGKLRGHRVSERGMRVPADALDAYLAGTEVQA